MSSPGKFTDPTAMDMNRTLGRKLIGVADRLRDLYTRFGLRPYKLRVVRIKWSGGRRGVGTPLVVTTKDILPTPKVMDLSGVTEIVQPVGLDEIGGILVTEISGTFTDEDLRFADSSGGPPGPDEEVYYEIEFPRPDGKPGDLRRFFLRSAPHYESTQFQWRIRLEKAHEDRARNGDYQ